MRVEPDGKDFVRFSVGDTGPGIPKNQTAAMFERSWQVGGQARPLLSLGLSICKSIIDAHGGRLWVVSDEGKGSTFFFTHPRASASE